MKTGNMSTTIATDRNQLVRSKFDGAMSYPAYRELVLGHRAAGTSTGPEQTEALSNYTLLNESRMKRLDKTTHLPEDVLEMVSGNTKRQTWLVITESWCGDAAQSMPVINKFAEASELIDLKVVLRDEHPELMDEFLYNGTRSIPVLIVYDWEQQAVTHVWGPRPTIANKMVADYKQAHGKLDAEFKKDLQLWYNKDKSNSIITDLVGYFE